MKNNAQIFLISIILVTIISTTACSSNSTTPSSVSSPVTPTATNTTAGDDAAIRAWADPETESSLQGFSEGNLAKYTQDGSPELIAALTQAAFDASAAQLKTKFGTYISKEFLSTVQQDVYIIVHYKAKFSKNSVGVRMVFDKNHKIAGQWFE